MQAVLKYPFRFIDKAPALHAASAVLSKASSFALDVEAFCTNTDQKHLGQISLLQFCTQAEPSVFIIDVLTLGTPAVVEALGPIMTDKSIRKHMFDCRRDVEALSSQMNLKAEGVLDLQLFHTAVQWKAKSVNRRSGMQHVLKTLLQIERQEGDNAVSAAMTLGKRAVWDVRPLADHFLEYAADDARHVLLLAAKLMEDHPDKVESIERLTALYVDHYAIGKPVTVEADPAPHHVVVEWLEMLLGPGGTCAFCNQKGHTEAECFKKQSGKPLRCSHCGELGHIATSCFKKHPQLMKCTHCGQLGHTAARCFALNPCKKCGGQHGTANCNVSLARTSKTTDKSS